MLAMKRRKKRFNLFGHSSHRGATERFVLDMRIVLLLLVLVEFIVFRKAKPWARLSFWIVGGFVFAYLFSR